jgi:hypothetical protein
VRLFGKGDAGGFRACGHRIDVAVSFDINPHPDAFRSVRALLTIVLGEAEPRVTALQHHAHQDAVVFPTILDFETKRGEERRALLNVVDGEAGHDAPAS